MKNGDLANCVSYTIGFRCVDFLVKYKTSTFGDKILNAVIGKVRRAEVDEKVRSVMEYFYRNTEYNVDLIVENKDYTADLKNLLDDLPFNRVVLIDKSTQITQRLLIGDLTFYVDDNDYRRSLVNSPYALSLDDLFKQIKMKRR